MCVSVGRVYSASPVAANTIGDTTSIWVSVPTSTLFLTLFHAVVFCTPKIRKDTSCSRVFSDFLLLAHVRYIN